MKKMKNMNLIMITDQIFLPLSFKMKLAGSAKINKGFHTSSPKNPVLPVVEYSNADINKSQIFQENRNKGGVYRWVNKVNQKTYIGSSVNLTQRFYKYYSVKYLLKHKTTIHQALIKYGYSNFILEILEYCDRDIVSREQYYIDMLNPEYNILETAGSSLGFKHSQETLDYFKNKRKVSEETRKNLSKSATGRVLSYADKKKI